MTLFPLGRASAIGVAILRLAGCGGSSQSAGTIPKGHQVLPRYPKRRHGLLYVGAAYRRSSIGIFPLTGPNQRQIGSITNGIDNPWGLSIDSYKSLYVANAGNSTVTVYPYGSTTPSMTYSIFGAALYALADSAGHVFLSGWNKHHQGHVIEFNAGRNRVIAHQQLGSETDGMAEDGQGNLYVAYRADGTFANSSIAEFSGPDLTNMRVLGMTVDQPQGLLVDRAGNIIVAESAADRIDVFPPGATAPSVTVTISGIGNLAELAMQNSETTLWVSSEGGYVYSMPYPLSWSTVAAEYEERLAESNGIAVTP